MSDQVLQVLFSLIDQVEQLSKDNEILTAALEDALDRVAALENGAKARPTVVDPDGTVSAVSEALAKDVDELRGWFQRHMQDEHPSRMLSGVALHHALKDLTGGRR
ncbi:hypothetical protein [Microvirga splendida]|uniref:Uncharacterized protein n=1 Tax=Microvirga splendida TaxID=2795727 RepID=A0ABS0XVH1_9HYPH|nr:hypothetical protein [Microvirga splendida]MBJ6124046.1 hypothetical protein [Microvirga splendida]